MAGHVGGVAPGLTASPSIFFQAKIGGLDDAIDVAHFAARAGL